MREGWFCGYLHNFLCSWLPTHHASFMFNLLSNLFCSFFSTSTFRSMKKEQNKFDNKMNIKDVRWQTPTTLVYRYLWRHFNFRSYIALKVLYYLGISKLFPGLLTWRVDALPLHRTKPISNYDNQRIELCIIRL